MDKDECEKCVRFQRGNCSLQLPPPKKWCFHFIEYQGDRMVPNTWAEGLNPKAAPLDDIGCRILLTATMAEMGGQPKAPNVEDPFPVKVMKKRIEVIKLPISFTDHAWLASVAFVRTPGAAVALLIDCLNAFEGQEVTVEKLIDLYPNGFYDEPSLMKYIDEYLKPRKVKWAEIY